MNKIEALQYIREKKGFVPYVTLFEIYGDSDEIPQGLIDLECMADRAPANFIICSAAVAEKLNEINNKFKTMDANTFGNSKRYKMLVVLTAHISTLPKNRREYLSTFISEFNYVLNRVCYEVKEQSLREYLCDVIYQDYMFKTNVLYDKYEKVIVTYLKNYIKAKIKNYKFNLL